MDARFMGVGAPAELIDWDEIDAEYAKSFPHVTLAEVNAKRISLHGTGLVEGTQRMLAWAVGLELQRSLVR